MPLIDAWLPTYDVRERHRTRVRATAEATYAALYEVDFGALPLARLLMGVRTLPAALRRGRAGVRELRERAGRPPRPTLRALDGHGFGLLEERPPTALVIGVEGSFWRTDGALCEVSPERFRAGPPAPGTARAAWDFTVRPLGDGTVELATETRVLCADDAARRRFRLYWTIVRPGSGIIRRVMLREVRRIAEGR